MISVIEVTFRYSGDKAQAALELMEEFVGDAIALYQTLSGQSWA